MQGRMVKIQKQKQKKSRSRRQQSRRRRQRGGGDESLAQGARFQSYHTTQHGGSRDALVGAPLDYSGVLEGGMRDAAGLAKYDAHFSQAQTHAQTGGSRRRRRSQRGGGLSPAEVGKPYTLLESYVGAGVPPPQAVGDHGVPSQMKGGRRSRRQQSRRQQSRRQQSRRQQSRRRSQRGGYAPVGQASMLLNDYSNAGLPSFKAI